MSEIVLTKPKQRDSNLELFRIITMFLIVAHHYVVNSGLTGVGGPIYSDPLSLRSLFLLLLGAWGKIGINCFVLISGYFMCKSNITAKKFVKLLGEVVFYRILIYIIFWVSGYEPFTLMGFVQAILPFMTVAHNFTGTYLLFFLCIPFLNVLVNHMNERQHIRLLLLSLFIYVFFGTLPLFSVTMNYVSWYIVLYFIASYIRLYPKKLFENTRFWGLMAFLCVLLSAASVVGCAFVGMKLGRQMAYWLVTDSNTFLAVLTGVCSFLFFKNLKLKYSPIINAISATTFGVLLIHAHSATMRKWLWVDILDNVGMYGSAWMPLHAIGSVIVIFAVCSVIDMCRIRLIEAPCLKLWDRWFGGLASKWTAWENKLCDKLNIGGKS